MGGYMYLVLFVFPFIVDSLSLEKVNEEWRHFKLKFNKTYTCLEEENYRFSVFADNCKTIFLHNEAADRGESTYWMGINKFADLTDTEFEEQYMGLKLRPDTFKRTKNKFLVKDFNLTRPSNEIDWRKLGCVTEVKDQGPCGSCYAFATTGALEGQTCRKTGKLVSLSEQNIIDCTTNEEFFNQGCNGGNVDTCYQYVQENGGVDTEISYPYKGKVGKCEFDKCNVGATIKGYIDKLRNEQLLKGVVGFLGPAYVYINMKGAKLYTDGIYDGKSRVDGSLCSKKAKDLNHGMTAIGYSRSTDGKDYWILKNSWGETWGEKGYMRLIRNHGNRCGIATVAGFPVV